MTLLSLVVVRPVVSVLPRLLPRRSGTLSSMWFSSTGGGGLVGALPSRISALSTGIDAAMMVVAPSAIPKITSCTESTARTHA